MTAICLLEAAFLTPNGRMDQREGEGEFQNVEDEDSELEEDEAEDSLEGSSNLEILL